MTCQNHTKEYDKSTSYTLFTRVADFYQDLIEQLDTARDKISMMYFTFDNGIWAQKISEMLKAKASQGIEVRLMVDAYGLVLDKPSHALLNRKLMADLREAGIRVDVFQPSGHRLSRMNRLHFKICAVDECIAYFGGSNIGDHYTTWDDTNLRLTGQLGNTLHQVYDYLHQFIEGGLISPENRLRLSDLRVGDAQLWFTIPKQRQDIRRVLLGMILEAKRELYFRNWYFLPDREILNAMRSQAQWGIGVNVLLSHKTRVRMIDIANYLHSHKLAKAGGVVYRFTKSYMHAKVAWTSEGDVLFGSANLDSKALGGNFECCVIFNNTHLARQLQNTFDSDKVHSLLQTPEVFRKCSLPKKALSYACGLAAPWL